MTQFDRKVQNLARSMDPAAAAALMAAPRTQQQAILAAYRTYSDTRGKCGAEISTPCGTGPRRKR